MSDRDRILSRLRSISVEPIALPEVAGPWLTIADPVASFGEMLESVGGRCESVASSAELDAGIARLAESIGARVVYSRLDPQREVEPADLAGVELAVARGELAVAENGAVWVSDSAVGDRAVLFLAQHVALVVEREAVVTHMHEAYERVEIDASPFGIFISGPSKTADIEQALVIGAHGPRSLTVFLLG